MKLALAMALLCMSLVGCDQMDRKTTPPETARDTTREVERVPENNRTTTPTR